jgi:hypothetical protein
MVPANQLWVGPNRAAGALFVCVMWPTRHTFEQNSPAEGKTPVRPQKGPLKGI